MTYRDVCIIPHINPWNNLRVLLVKRPDMMVPTFFAQYQFVCNIKSTYQVDMPGTKNFDVGGQHSAVGSNFSFRSKAKMSQCAPHFFSTFYQFSNRFLLTIQHIKNSSRLFFVSAKYCHFSLSAWSKMKNFDIFYKM